MKKTFLFLASVILIFLLSACGQKKQTQNQEQNQKQNQIQNQQPGDNSGGVISSIKDAMGMGKKMECTYKMKTGNETIESKTYVDGQKYKGQIVINGKNQNSLFDGKIIYTWVDGEKTGTKLDTECLKDMEKDMPGQTQDKPKQFEAKPEDFEDAMDVSCQPAANVDFLVPQDVVFTDQCEMIKKSLEGLKNLPNKYEGMPAGITPTD